jgi:tRNA (cmo5U34)-methyltransferase
VYRFDPETYAEVIAEIPAYERLQDELADATRGADGPILDLGTGTGVTAHRVKQLHPRAHVTGLDENAEMLARAELDATVVARLEDPLPPGPFGLVTSALAVHHLDGPGKADLFARIARILQPGGVFVLGDLIVPEDPADVVTEIDGVYDRPSTLAEQLRWLADAGLTAETTWRQQDLAVIRATL